MLREDRGRDERSAALRHLLAVDGEVAVHEQSARLAVAGARQHRGPEQRVEVRNVLADEVVELVCGCPRPRTRRSRGSSSPAEIQEARHVADRRVEPDVEELVALAGDPEAEVGRIARDVPVLEAGLEPLVELARERGVDVLRHPLAQLALEGAELQEQVLGLARRPASCPDSVETASLRSSGE